MDFLLLLSITLDYYRYGFQQNTNKLTILNYSRYERFLIEFTYTNRSRIARPPLTCITLPQISITHYAANANLLRPWGSNHPQITSMIKRIGQFIHIFLMCCRNLCRLFEEVDLSL